MAAPGCLSSSASASSAVTKSPGTNSPCLVDEEAAVGVAVPGDAEVGLLGDDARADLAAVLLEQRVGLVVGEGAVDLEVHLDAANGRALEDERGELAGDAVGGVHDDAERRQRRRRRRTRRCRRRPGTGPPPRSRRRAAAAGALGDRLTALLELGDALLAAERQRPCADELHAVVLRRVVRCGDHGAAVEAARGDAVVEHLGGDQAEVDGRGAGGGGARGEGARAPLDEGRGSMPAPTVEAPSCCARAQPMRAATSSSSSSGYSPRTSYALKMPSGIVISPPCRGARS